jgi:hypothetical protein
MIAEALLWTPWQRLGSGFAGTPDQPAQGYPNISVKP